MTVVEDLYLYHFPNMNDYLHYECPENVYFLYFAPNPNHSENAPFEGITAESMTRGTN